LLAEVEFWVNLAQRDCLTAHHIVNDQCLRSPHQGLSLLLLDDDHINALRMLLLLLLLQDSSEEEELEEVVEGGTDDSKGNKVRRKDKAAASVTSMAYARHGTCLDQWQTGDVTHGRPCSPAVTCC
jgi:hypothetical protein